MPYRYPSFCSNLPHVWLVSDARNDQALETVLKRLPRGSGFIFRHYHLDPAARRARFDRLKRLAHARGHCVILSGPPQKARNWGADGAYGAPCELMRGPAMLRLTTAHSLKDIGQAQRARSSAVLLSPVFRTRSHRDAVPLGALRFHLLAAYGKAPLIALGGMNAQRARMHRIKKWAAIDGI